MKCRPCLRNTPWRPAVQSVLTEHALVPSSAGRAYGTRPGAQHRPDALTPSTNLHVAWWKECVNTTSLPEPSCSPPERMCEHDEPSGQLMRYHVPVPCASTTCWYHVPVPQAYLQHRCKPTCLFASPQCSSLAPCICCPVVAGPASPSHTLGLTLRHPGWTSGGRDPTAACYSHAYILDIWLERSVAATTAFMKAARTPAFSSSWTPAGGSGRRGGGRCGAWESGGGGGG